MTRVDFICEQFELPLYRGTQIVTAISSLIAEEIEAQAQFLEVEGDLYGVVGGLRKAAAIARTHKQEGNESNV